VTRRRSATDERVLVVELTPAGRELRREAEKIPQRILARLGMEPSELASLRGALQAITAATAASPSPADTIPSP
jgi:DNA-binding MarR family transcriptional regulator